MHNYVLFAIIVHINIQKLKNKQTFIQTEKAKSSHFERTRGDKNQIFSTLMSSQSAVLQFRAVVRSKNLGGQVQGVS